MEHNFDRFCIPYFPGSFISHNGRKTITKNSIEQLCNCTRVRERHYEFSFCTYLQIKLPFKHLFRRQFAVAMNQQIFNGVKLKTDNLTNFINDRKYKQIRRLFSATLH